MSVSIDLQMKVAEWRNLARQGKLTADQLREALIALRGARVAAAGASAKSRTKKEPKKAVDSEALLGELDDLFGGGKA